MIQHLSVLLLLVVAWLQPSQAGLKLPVPSPPSIALENMDEIKYVPDKATFYSFAHFPAQE